MSAPSIQLRAFVLPGGEVIGPDAARVALAAGIAPASLPLSGTMEAWRRDVAARALGNPRLAFALSIAFASPIADLLGEPGAIVNLVGRSSSGKSTLARCAASAWGVRLGTWRGTANGIEAVFASSSGILCILDEIGQATPEDVALVAYAHGNGTGKARARRDGSARATAQWLVYALSTGEITFAALLIRRKMKPDAGQLVRFLDVPVVADSAAYGAFADLHGMEGGAAFAHALDAAARANQGHAGRAFVGWLLDQDDHADLTRQAVRLAEKAISARTPRGTEAQAVRAGIHFARIAAAGEIATQAGVTGWPPGTATDAAVEAFLAFLGAREAGGADAEGQAAIRRTREALQLHGANRFVALTSGPKTLEDLLDDTPRTEAMHTPFGGSARPSYGPQWGYTSLRYGQRVFWFSDAGWRAIHEGFGEIQAARALSTAGFLIRGEGQNLKARLVTPDGNRQRFFAIRETVLHDT